MRTVVDRIKGASQHIWIEMMFLLSNEHLKKKKEEMLLVKFAVTVPKWKDKYIGIQRSKTILVAAYSAFIS